MLYCVIFIVGHDARRSADCSLVLPLGYYIFCHLFTLPINHIVQVKSAIHNSSNEVLEGITNIAVVRDEHGKVDHVVSVTYPSTLKVVKQASAGKDNSI